MLAPMKALLLHDIGSDDPFAAALRSAGHEVIRCAPPGRPGFPCDGSKGACPLDATVDVAVVVHDRPSTDISPGEAGAVCALRDGVPLVLAGHARQHPFGDRIGAVAASPDDVVSACERAVAGRLAALGRRVGGTVVRDGDAIRVTLPPGASSAQAVLAHQALKAAARAARIVDVEIAQRPDPEVP